jgi:hypothetical protein
MLTPAALDWLRNLTLASNRVPGVANRALATPGHMKSEQP